MTEILKLPKEVVDTDWKDMDYETYGKNEQEEMEYVAPEDIPKDSIERIKSIDLRPLLRERGKKIINILKSEQLAA